MRVFGSGWLFAASLVLGDAVAADRPPIIDMHLHAHTLEDYGGGGRVCTNDAPMEFPGVDPRQPITIEAVMHCAHPRESAKSDEAVMRESLGELERFNIYAVTSGSLAQVEKWRAAAPARIIPAISFLAQAPFLSAEQKRDIFYNNAARFLRLSPAEQQRHSKH